MFSYDSLEIVDSDLGLEMPKRFLLLMFAQSPGLLFIVLAPYIF